MVCEERERERLRVCRGVSRCCRRCGMSRLFFRRGGFRGVFKGMLMGEDDPFLRRGAGGGVVVLVLSRDGAGVAVHERKLDVLIGSTVVYRGQVGAARPGAARVRVVMSLVWGVAVVDGDGDGVPGSDSSVNGGVWALAFGWRGV